MKLTYEPIETQPAPHRPDLATDNRVCCPQCGKTYVATQAVLVAGPMPLTHEGRYQLFCDHCCVVHEWPALCAENLLPGTQLGDHITLTGLKFIKRFLREHPEAAGMEQV